AHDPGGVHRHSISRDLSLLYRLALDMGSAPAYEDLVTIVLGGLLEAVPADVGAVLSVAAGGDMTRGVAVGDRNLRGVELEVTAHRHRDPSVKHYAKVSDFVSNEVLGSGEAILAEDVARDRYLRSRESLSDLGATSLICAPIIHGGRCFGLIHLYCM